MGTDESILPSSRKIKFIAVGIPVLLMLYVLSIGPVSKLDDSGYVSDRTNQVLCAIYAPLSLLHRIPAGDKVLNWYIFHVWNCDTMGDNTI